MIFNQYPYSNFHELNDDWIIKTLREFGEKLDEFVAMNSLTYADPIGYDPDSIYAANTVVIYDNAAYVSKQAIPAGMLPTNADYWLLIFPFGDLIDGAVEDMERQIDEALAAAQNQLETAINTLPSLVNVWMTEHPDVVSAVPSNSVNWQKLNQELRNVILADYVEAAEAQDIVFTEQGGLVHNTGAEFASTQMCRTGFLHFPEGVMVFGLMSGYLVTIYRYDADGNYIDHNYVGSTITPAAGFVAIAVAPGEQYRFDITIDGITEFTPADLPYGVLLYQIYQPESYELNKKVVDLEYAHKSYTDDVSDQYTKWAADLYLNGSTGVVARATTNILEKVVSIPITGGQRYTVIAGYITTLRVASGTLQSPPRNTTTHAYVTNNGLTNKIVCEPPAGDTYLYVQCFATGDAVEDLDEHLRKLHVYPAIDTNLLDDVQPHKLYDGDGIAEINHRGYQTVAPENTIPAFRLSVENGYNWIECDVHLTSDNVPVILHDNSINRTARNADGTAISGTVNIASITYEQALQYDFGIWKGQEYAGTKIPTLAQVLDFARCTGIKVAIELKDTAYDPEKFAIIYAVVKQYAMFDYVEFFGGDMSNMITLARIVKNTRIGWADNQTTPTLNANTLMNLMKLHVNNNIVFFHTNPPADDTAATLLNEINDAGISMIFRAHTTEQIAAAPSYAHMFISNSLHPKTVLYNSAMGIVE